jgi:hypothetical protein
MNLHFDWERAEPGLAGDGSSKKRGIRPISKYLRGFGAEEGWLVMMKGIVPLGGIFALALDLA